MLKFGTNITMIPENKMRLESCCPTSHYNKSEKSSK